MERFAKLERSGWCVNMFAVRLPDGRSLIHSPTWLGEGTFEKVEALGPPGVLFAPNHFHHLSLARFRARYPDAIAVASEGALRRLGAKGHRGLRELADAEPLLPPGARFLRCEGLRSGEAWLSLGDGDRRTLLVGDAFFHVREPMTGMAGFVLRRLATVPGLCLGDTFRWLAVADRAKYRAWATSTLAREAPECVAVSHGETLEGRDLGQRLASLVDERLA